MKAYQQLFAEMKRRSAFKVIAVYGATAFVLLHVADLLREGLKLPASFLPFVTAFALLGFPLALVLAWAFELTPDGVRRMEAAAPEEIERILEASALKRWPAGLLALAGFAAMFDPIRNDPQYFAVLGPLGLRGVAPDRTPRDARTTMKDPAP